MTNKNMLQSETDVDGSLKASRQPQSGMGFDGFQFYVSDLDFMTSCMLTGGDFSYPFAIFENEFLKKHRYHRYIMNIIRGMELGEEQILPVIELICLYKDKADDILYELKQYQHEVIQERNDERAMVFDMLNDGFLDDSEARDMVAELNICCRYELNNNTVKDNVRQALLVCQAKLFEEMNSILKKEQLELFEIYKSKLVN